MLLANWYGAGRYFGHTMRVVGGVCMITIFSKGDLRHIGQLLVLEVHTLDFVKTPDSQC